MWVCGRTPVCTCVDACARRLTGQDTLTERPQSIFSPSSVVLPFFPFLSTFPLPFPFLAPDPSAPPCLSWVSLSNLILRSPYVLPLAYQGPEWLLCKYLDGAASAEEPRGCGVALDFPASLQKVPAPAMLGSQVGPLSFLHHQLPGRRGCS